MGASGCCGVYKPASGRVGSKVSNYLTYLER